MKQYIIRSGLMVRCVVLWALCGAYFPSGQAAETGFPAASPVYDYANPPLVTGTLYAVESDQKKILFTFRRTATRSGSVVQVERQFLATNGTLAAVEKIRYESNQFVSYQMQDFQARVSGAIQIEPDPQDPDQQQIYISHAKGLNAVKGKARVLEPDTLMDDTLYPFLIEHWDDLMQGKAVKFHFVSLEWERTFEFCVAKSRESTQNGRPVVEFTMKPTNFLVAAQVKPIIFTLEKNGTHRMLSYVGRTTPRVKIGKSWKLLDAETVFNN
jgi:hypothetical protein